MNFSTIDTFEIIPGHYCRGNIQRFLKYSACSGTAAVMDEEHVFQQLAAMRIFSQIGSIFSLFSETNIVHRQRQQDIF